MARRYAKAFTEKYNEPILLDTMSVQLKEFAEVFDREKILRVIMLHPAVDPGEKQNALKQIARALDASEQTAEALSHLLKKGRLPLVKLVAGEFEKISNNILGKVRVEVTTAAVISDSDRSILAGKFTAVSGKEAVIEHKVDPSLVGGIVARIGSVVYDGSIKNQLKALRAGLE
ncbi:ATP synthase delta chain [hydrothermal vent metagenome]|uniref:ATP synthase delta chain n=1 Tax=hydrothermal vent metagenome TaxID=652676 RepID=A0A3B1BS98_9ZZZZ